MAGQPFRPENAVFGMLIDGKRSSFRLTSLKEAEAMTVNLVAQGRRIEIFDYATKKIVKTLS